MATLHGPGVFVLLRRSRAARWLFATCSISLAAALRRSSRYFCFIGSRIGAQDCVRIERGPVLSQSAAAASASSIRPTRAYAAASRSPQNDELTPLSVCKASSGALDDVLHPCERSLEKGVALLIMRDRPRGPLICFVELSCIGEVIDYTGSQLHIVGRHRHRGFGFFDRPLQLPVPAVNMRHQLQVLVDKELRLVLRVLGLAAELVGDVIRIAAILKRSVGLAFRDVRPGERVLEERGIGEAKPATSATRIAARRRSST